jgi:hypothetical protein
MDTSKLLNDHAAAAALLLSATAKHMQTKAIAEEVRAEAETLRSQMQSHCNAARVEGFKVGFAVAIIPCIAVGACLAMLIRAVLQ